jgi:hypothetical protein
VGDYDRYHTEECLRRNRELALARGQWEAAWPNHCRACEGWGGREESYDPSPAGVSLSPGSMTDFEPCEKCGASDLCPRCGVPLPTPGERAKRRWNRRAERLLRPTLNFKHRLYPLKQRLVNSRPYRALALPLLDLVLFEEREWGLPPCRACGWKSEGAPPPGNECEGCSPEYLAESSWPFDEPPERIINLASN